MPTFTLKVEQIRREINDAITICFKQPGLKKIKYQAGQYLTLIFRINGRRYVRPYSLSSAPGIDSYLEVTVKRTYGGVISNHINDCISIGDHIEVMEPMGDFVFDEKELPSNINHVILWGAGSGITPLISILKHLLNNYPTYHVTLVYGNRQQDSIMFLDLIRTLENQFSHRLHVWFFNTKAFVAETNPYLVQGRIQPSKVLSVISREGELGNTVHYICGPVGLKESVICELLKLGVSQKMIYTEDFEVVRNPQDFEDIVTRDVIIQFRDRDHHVEVVKGKSILEAGLDSAIELSYSCQTGHCNVCKGKLKEGEIRMIGSNIKTENLAPGEYLLCCSYPLTDTVKVIAIN